jgi:hypothetical protein
MNKSRSVTTILILLILLLGLILVPAIPLRAQQAVGDSIPAASGARPREPFVILDSLHYRVAGDGAFSRGNVNRSLAVLRAEVNYDGPVVALSTHPRFTYGKQNGLLAERDLYVDLFVDLYKKRKVYTFGLGTLETSNLRGIRLRQLAGAGVGWRLLERDRHTVSLTNAVIYESTNFRERATLSTLRNSTRLKGRHAFLADKIRLTHLTFLQPSLYDISNLRWSTIITLEMPLSKWATFRTSFENTFESVVEATRKRNDSRLTVGFAVGNKK